MLNSILQNIVFKCFICCYLKKPNLKQKSLQNNGKQVPSRILTSVIFCIKVLLFVSVLAGSQSIIKNVFDALESNVLM